VLDQVVDFRTHPPHPEIIVEGYDVFGLEMDTIHFDESDKDWMGSGYAVEEGGRKSWSSDKVLLWTALYWDSCRTSCIQIPKKTKQIWYQRKLLRELTRENYWGLNNAQITFITLRVHKTR
jgi:hypothetical protein